MICAAYVACIVRLTSFPMQDYANHVARADVMADLLFHHGARFGQVFQVHLTPLPYVLPDLILMSAVEIFGVAAGAALFSSLVILSLPCALLFYARSCNIPRRARPFVFLLGLYLSIDWFFIAGFLAFQLSLALIVMSLALAEILAQALVGAGIRRLPPRARRGLPHALDRTAVHGRGPRCVGIGQAVVRDDHPAP